MNLACSSSSSVRMQTHILLQEKTGSTLNLHFHNARPLVDSSAFGRLHVAPLDTLISSRWVRACIAATSGHGEELTAFHMAVERLPVAAKIAVQATWQLIVWDPLLLSDVAEEGIPWHRETSMQTRRSDDAEEERPAAHSLVSPSIIQQVTPLGGAFKREALRGLNCSSPPSSVTRQHFDDMLRAQQSAGTDVVEIGAQPSSLLLAEEVLTSFSKALWRISSSMSDAPMESLVSLCYILLSALLVTTVMIVPDLQRFSNPGAAVTVLVCTVAVVSLAVKVRASIKEMAEVLREARQDLDAAREALQTEREMRRAQAAMHAEEEQITNAEWEQRLDEVRVQAIFSMFLAISI